MGMERLVLMLETLDLVPVTVNSAAALYIVAVGDGVDGYGLRVAEHLRNELPGLRIQAHCGGGSFKSQMKKADRSGAALALILGQEEMNNGVVGIKPLRHAGEQRQVALPELARALTELLAPAR